MVVWLSLLEKPLQLHFYLVTNYLCGRSLKLLLIMELSYLTSVIQSCQQVA